MKQTFYFTKRESSNNHSVNYYTRVKRIIEGQFDEKIIENDSD